MSMYKKVMIGTSVAGVGLVGVKMLMDRRKAANAENADNETA